MNFQIFIKNKLKEFLISLENSPKNDKIMDLLEKKHNLTIKITF